MDAGVLLDAKGKYSQFINKDTGEFFDWFKGKDYLLQEAQRQIVASEGLQSNGFCRGRHIICCKRFIYR